MQSYETKIAIVIYTYKLCNRDMCTWVYLCMCVCICVYMRARILCIDDIPETVPRLFNKKVSRRGARVIYNVYESVCIIE